jgi:hypothetical protein
LTPTTIREERRDPTVNNDDERDHEEERWQREDAARMYEEERQAELAERKALPVEELNLTVRSYNCLKRAGIRTVGDLVTRSEIDLMDLRNFGTKSIDEVNAKLASMGLALAREPYWSGLSANFSPDEVNSLIRMAAEVAGAGRWAGNFSERQIELAKRAWALMGDDCSGLPKAQDG